MPGLQVSDAAMAQAQATFHAAAGKLAPVARAVQGLDDQVAATNALETMPAADDLTSAMARRHRDAAGEPGAVPGTLNGPGLDSRRGEAAGAPRAGLAVIASAVQGTVTAGLAGAHDAAGLRGTGPELTAGGAP